MLWQAISMAQPSSPNHAEAVVVTHHNPGAARMMRMTAASLTAA